jgi:hypothetical protein
MTEDKPDLERGVNETYRGSSRELKAFCDPMIHEMESYCLSLAAYNQLIGKENPEQSAATSTGLLMMARLLGEAQKRGNRFLYVMAETLFKDYAKKEAKWDDTQIEAYLKKAQEKPKEGGQ